MDGVRIKLSAVASVLKDRRVVLVDDSIVRGTTMTRVVALLREAGAKEVHVRITAPPFCYPCFYGTDIDSQDGLIACHHTVAETAALIGADSLGYLPLDALRELACGEGYCSACFSGAYPTAVPAQHEKNRFERKIHG